MNTTFTVAEVYSMVMALCGAIITVSAAIAVIFKAYQLLKKPEKTQDERIKVLEQKVERHDQLFNNDNKRLKTLEDGHRVEQQALLALLSHALNGNDIESLKEAKDKLQNYLIGKDGE